MAGRSTNQDEAERGKAEEKQKVKQSTMKRGGGGVVVVVQVPQRKEGVQKRLL